MTEFEVEVWLKGKEEKAVTVTVEAVPPLNPMNVRDWCCRMNIFEWRDYQRIRYRRVKK